MFYKILIFIGGLFLAYIIITIIYGLARAIRQNTKPKLGLLYFKNWPDGRRTFRVVLDVDLQNVKHGDVYLLTCKKEDLTTNETEIYNELLDL